MFGSAAPTPPVPALPDPLPPPPSYNAGAPQGPAGTANKPPPGWGGTLLTSGQGVDSSGTNLAKKSLLGQ